MTGKSPNSINSICFFSNKIFFFLAEWNLNGKALDRESSRFVFTNNEKEFSLEIPVVLATDQGQYNIAVSNDKGDITAAYSLHVDH